MKHLIATLLLVFSTALAVMAGDLTTITGITYKNATIMGHDAVGLEIVFDDGFARVRFRDLPAELRKKYGYNPDAEAAQLEAESRAEAQRAAAQQAIQEQQQAAEAARENAGKEAAMDKVQVEGRVCVNSSDGLLLTRSVVFLGSHGDESRFDVFLLRGYPGQKEVAVNQQISAVAVVDGPYQYSAPDGTLKTVKAYRYMGGEPTDHTESLLGPKTEFQGSMLDQPAHR